MNLKKTATIPLLVAAGIVLGQLPGHIFKSESGRPPENMEQNLESDGENAQPKVLYWYDPMYPGTRFEQPGRSPFMDMDLIPRYADDEGFGVRVDPAQLHNLSVRTEKAVRGRLSFVRDIPANLEFNDYQLAKVQPRAEGFVEKTYSLAPGDMIKTGAPITDITVPGWASDQSEYLLLKNQQGDSRLALGVRERLRLTGMPEAMLKAVDASGRVQTRLTIQAPLSGVITGIDVYPGMNVDKNMTIAVIQGTDPIWVTAQVPEQDIHLLNSGSRIRISVPAWPDQVFYPLSFTLLPQASPDTRTVPLRLSLDNRLGLLKPGMTATVRLRGSGDEALLIPTSALIDLGEEKRVIVRGPQGRFMPKAVQALHSSREKTAILSGLEEGDEVVVSGLFLIDSEANLQGALERMREENAGLTGAENGEKGL
ncbi:MAG: efflux RND transporter periplasmic adaptor subunit [Desulfarculales bacterium]|jgi:Cu(I)/Ag(I) efflux system membrane fusion protein|nr:efflux RND transporter periplasmic adaptor subunit [Desulfarculales bacterium]